MRSLLMRCLFSAGAAMFGLSLATAASAAAPPGSGKSVGQGEFQIAQRRDICCNHHGRYVWLSHRRCEEHGGHHVRDRFCRRDGYGDHDGQICCNHHGRYVWLSHRRCEEHGGRHVSRRYCRYGGGGYRRVCCARGRYDWWVSSARRCQRAGGHVVPGRRCYRGRDDRPRRQVCCYRRFRGFRQFRVMNRWNCDRWGGRQVRWHYCRR